MCVVLFVLYEQMYLGFTDLICIEHDPNIDKAGRKKDGWISSAAPF